MTVVAALPLSPRGVIVPRESSEATSMSYDTGNIFAKILRGEIPSHKVYEDDDAESAIAQRARRRSGRARENSTHRVEDRDRIESRVRR